jgi:hypothetical protein
VVVWKLLIMTSNVAPPKKSTLIGGKISVEGQNQLLSAWES